MTKCVFFHSTFYWFCIYAHFYGPEGKNRSVNARIDSMGDQGEQVQSVKEILIHEYMHSGGGDGTDSQRVEEGIWDPPGRGKAVQLGLISAISLSFWITLQRSLCIVRRSSIHKDPLASY